VAGALGFAGVLAVVRRKRTEALDLAVTLRLQAVRHAFLARIMTAVSWPGFSPQSRIIPPLIIALEWLSRYRLEALIQGLAWGTAALATIFKSFMDRPRPVAGTDLRVVAADLGGTSFPSGHVLSYVGTYGWLAVVVGLKLQPVWLRRVIVGCLASVVALVGPSRIYQGHHWATDVTASYLLGFSYLAGLVTLYRQLRSRRVLS
jgi:membrane-associated phospholipid phosphatase